MIEDWNYTDTYRYDFLNENDITITDFEAYYFVNNSLTYDTFVVVVNIDCNVF